MQNTNLDQPFKEKKPRESEREREWVSETNQND